MSRERRYDDEEVAEILERAAQAEIASRPAHPSPTGLSLDELQRIGAEAGLAPELITAAARSLDGRNLPSRKIRIAGLPIGVEHAVPLARPFTQSEWERMVTRFRQTFRARGRVQSDGNLRLWSNGNLQAAVEPDGDGWVLRFSTRKSEAAGFLAMAVFALVGLAVAGVLGLLSETANIRALMFAGMGVVGGAVLGSNVLRLPSWSAEREGQFRELGERAMHITATPPSDRDAPALEGPAPDADYRGR